ncbi:hypothetical protein [Secundilactobacillus pentosiphilus]|uniref:hypothetical protein n=1 Tax=Secundilactobacillus pentosiphilus TaxID=1714682 RepID=UPI00117A1D9E|nr:hypothetical protein [Secundilactobacillus pentosiphilus]
MDKRGDEKELTEYHLGDVIATAVDGKKVIQMVSARPIGEVVIYEDGNYAGKLDRFCMVNLSTGVSECISNSLKELFRNRHVHEDRLVKAHVVIDRDDSHG